MQLWQDIATNISQLTGKAFSVEQKSSVGGGCINSAYRISNGRQNYFVKLNSAEQLEMFIAEAEGLQEMASANAIKVPTAVCYGSSGGQAYLVMEALDMGGSKPGVMALFGEQLAAMHRYTKDRYGWHRDNTIGSTPQPNDWHHDWLSFWRDRRLGFQLKLAAANGAGHGLINKGEQLQDNIEVFFPGYQPEASLLHGDLWSGNYSITAQGEPVIFDPAVYFGDREADIAMTELFGGFGQEFYAAYNQAWPLDEGYSVRKTFYNLYHILNHFNLFGGGYASQAEGMLDRLLAEI
ncbi:MAG: fructosamine kinase family protein [Thioalkalispiraceae bacterium]|jgi:fructosamine-3-kinase